MLPTLGDTRFPMRRPSRCTVPRSLVADTMGWTGGLRCDSLPSRSFSPTTRPGRHTLPRFSGLGNPSAARVERGYIEELLLRIEALAEASQPAPSQAPPPAQVARA